MLKSCPVCESVCTKLGPYITFDGNKRYYCKDCGSRFEVKVLPPTGTIDILSPSGIWVQMRNGTS